MVVLIFPSSGNKLLNNVETCSLLLLMAMTSINLFWANVYVNNNDIDAPDFRNIGAGFLVLETVVLVLPVILLIGLLTLQIVRKIVNLFYSKYIKNQKFRTI